MHSIFVCSIVSDFIILLLDIAFHAYEFFESKSFKCIKTFGMRVDNPL